MGVVFVTAKIATPQGNSKKLDFLVDSGATYSLLPEEIWKSIGLSELKKRIFSLRDGTRITLPISECRLSFKGNNCTTPVILGAKGATPLLGNMTLASMGLVLNPFTRELKTKRMAMKIVPV